MNRFYADVAIGPAVGGGWVILLDSRPIRTPAKALMMAPSEKLAQAIAKEWRDQSEVVLPETMPLTQLLTTSIDRAQQRDEMTNIILAYLDSDLLCYRTADPQALTIEQEKLWSPWLDWFESTYSEILATTFELARLDQPRHVHEKMRAIVETMDIATFTVLQTAISLTGSIVLALALIQNAIKPAEVWQCVLCEELFYERTHDLERHGLDPIEARRRDALLRDLEACAHYLALNAPTTL